MFVFINLSTMCSIVYKYFRTITEIDIIKGDTLLRMAVKTFCEKFPDDEAPNLHLALHLKDDIRRFGPAPV